MAASRPTVRTIAKSLKLSRSTVANALRGLSSVKPTTRIRVQRAAKTMGYSVQPFASAVMSQMRRSGQSRLLGTLAVLEMDEPGRPSGAAIFHKKLFEGIEKRAADMGFMATRWTYGGAKSLPLTRLNQILQWRGIQGLLFMPTWSEPDFRALDWARFTAIYVDYLVRSPALHTVSTDHFRSLSVALEKARSLGYRRPGFAVARRADERLGGRWTGAYLSHLHSHPEVTAVPPLLADDINEECFLPWFRAHDPDVVITHWLDAPRHMTAEGAEIPRKHGFICLNVLPAPPEFSGIDLQPRLLGARSVELVVGQLMRHDRGVPELASNTLIPSRWIDGATLARRK